MSSTDWSPPLLPTICPYTGLDRGPNPPRKSDVIPLKKDSEHWDDRWIDKTGEWNYKMLGDVEVKYVQCKCGDKPWTGHRGRFARCFECKRVYIDLEWEDDRFKNPRLEDENEQGGLSEWV